MLIAQRHCSSTEHLIYQLQTSPDFKQKRAAIEEQTQRMASPTPRLRGQSPILIPVVVNLVYSMEAENISDAQILSQIDALNEDYKRLNRDADNRWPQAAATDIEFRLAVRDPNQLPTSGIRRQITSKASFLDNDEVKSTEKGGLDPWPTTDYLNIWICNLEFPLEGYAQYPGGPSATDGVVIDYACFGRSGIVKPPFHLGRTATHEVGHWLNLDHLWGDGDCAINDRVEDTPPCDRPHFMCQTDARSCGVQNMVQNFMEYSDDACMNLFTHGQVDRMMALFMPGGFRERLLDSRGCALPLFYSSACGDGVQNGQEKGIDCGSPDCPPCKPSGCLPPQTLQYTQQGSIVTLLWAPYDNATAYEAEVRQVTPSVGSWLSRTTTDPYVTITGFRIGRTYVWRVKTICADGESAYANSSFTTRSGDNSNRLAATPSFLSPNPTDGYVLIHLDRLEGWSVGATVSPIQVGLRIEDQSGKMVLQRRLDGGTSVHRIELADLPSGLYTVQLYDAAGGIDAVERLVVIKD